MNDEQFRIACEKELKYIAKQERKLQKQAMASEKTWKKAIESVIPEKIYVNLRAAFATAFNIIFEKGVDVIEKTYSKERLLKDFESQDLAVDDIQTRRELRKFRSSVSSSKRWKSIITTAEGVGLGVLGIGLPDIVLFLGFILICVPKWSI
ncbi:MAG: EcsC family protein [Bacillota bacterium]